MNETSPRVISIGYGRQMFIPGNQERLRMEQCALQVSELHMVIFTRSTDALEKSDVTNNLTLYPTASTSKPRMVFDAFRIARSIIKSNRDKTFIVTTQDPFEAGLVGLLLKAFYGVRLVVQEHGDVYSTPYWRRESVLNTLRYVFGKFALAYADSVRVVSMRTKAYFEKKRYPHIVTLPVAIDTTSFTSATPNSIVRDIFGPDTFVFLSVARFVPQKNLTMLLEAFSKIHAIHRHARLLLVGTGAEEKKLKTLSKELFGVEQSPVSFLPWSDDVAGLMKASNAYALSSFYEGWGRVLIEAMVVGLPVVTTNVGCAGEVIKNREHGLVVPLDDVHAFVDAGTEIIQDTELYQRIRENLKTLRVDSIPGADLEDYGSRWVKTLLT